VLTLVDVSDGAMREFPDLPWGVQPPLAFSPDGLRIAAGTHDNQVVIWEVATGRRQFKLAAAPGDLTHSLHSLAFSPDSGRLVSGAGGGEVRLWRLSDGGLETRFPGHTEVVAAVAFDPTGETLLTGSWDTTARLWRVRDGVELAVFRDESSSRASVSSVAFSPNGRLIAVGTTQGLVRVYDISNISTPNLN
jgi:WD40 repeat protein